MTKWQWIWRQFSSKLWLRAAMFCVAGIVTALFALLVKGFIPDSISRQVGAEAVDAILQIIASSMLAVTTFSLSTMVAAYSAATSNATPRATKLLLRDRTAQTALSVFIGAFLFSLVGIIALQMGVYGDNGRLVLFVVTILVIFIIVTVLLNWIDHLSRLGRVGETVDLVERATLAAIEERLAYPYLGGRMMGDFTPDATHHPVVHPEIGYVQHIDMHKLSCLAEKYGVYVFILGVPGNFNDGHKPIAYSSAPLDEEMYSALRDAFIIGDDRSFDQDPRYGLIVLSEIASRALSPGINDPGTAIDVIGTAVRVLAPWVTHDWPHEPPKYPRLYVPAILIDDMFDDIFAPIARDGAGLVEIGIRLQKALASLESMGDADCKRAAVRHSQLTLKRALKSLALDEDKEKLRALAL